MASHSADTPITEPEVDELPPAPLSGTHSQALQRLQIGLFGLGAMVLLVALANIIMTNAQENDARVVPEAASTVAHEDEGAASDPLADAGVLPDAPADAAPSQAGDAGNAAPQP
jgi:hypothetical protein